MELLLLVCLCLLSCSGDGASEPSVTTIKTNEGTMLQCEVLGTASETKVEWQDSSGKKIQAEKNVTKSGDSYNIVLKAAVTKTDTFSCVVTEGSSSPVSAEIHAAVTGAAAAPGSNTGLVTLWFLVLLLLF